MELHMILIHRLLCIFSQNPDKDYTADLDGMDIINILIDMKLIHLFLKIYTSDREYDQKLFINVTPKGFLFIKSFNNILDNNET
ncbi:hypothetical protein [Macrococcoides caseolyticum]|uniref:hypothetical protein n=1 Tax=Macrococcoides caseolyticum TaxID=69966 RepID=UPI0024BC03D1|nr:hypothetical protein [Macrococcus caseolyticus]MDJ1087925.1 hypothetical protein [Macrococcus caseolyticus]